MEARSGPRDVDVIIPAFNAGRYIRSALDSVLAQTYVPAKVIVIDDGSTDNTSEIVREMIVSTDGPVRIELLNTPNGGPSGARNLGIQKSNASFLAFLDADDLWHPEKLERQIQLFHQGGAGLGLVYCGHQVIDENGGQLPVLHQNPEMPSGQIFERMLKANLINASATASVVRRACFTSSGLFDESIRSMEDWDMWLRISQHYTVDRIMEPLVSIRHHSESAQTDTFGMLKGSLAFYKKWFPIAKSRPAVMKIWGHMLAEYVIRSKSEAYARKYVEQELSQEMRSVLFARTLGSFKLYLTLKYLRRAIQH
jgi:glycosyltransferase involved in cell wall biosynthesis